MIKKIMEWISELIPKNIQPKEHEKRIVLLVGESGSGKTTLANALEQLGYTQVASYTTRPRRFPSEKNHEFVSAEEFVQMRETLVTYTNFDGHDYGATPKQIEQNHLFVVDPDGVEYLIENWGRQNLLIVYLYVTTIERLARLTLERGEKEANQRIEHDTWKFAGFHNYDLLLPNETSEQFKRNVETLDLLVGGWCNEWPKSQ